MHAKCFGYLLTSTFATGQQTRTFTEAVEQYSQLGLRTLCLAWRELKEDEYREWSLMFKEANSTLVDREVESLSLYAINFGGVGVCNICGLSNCYVLQWRLAEVCQRLEHDLEILGVTAIEDRLQVWFFVYLGIDFQYLAKIFSSNYLLF